MPGVKRERVDTVGVLTLDEPATLNAMTPDLLGDPSAKRGWLAFPSTMLRQGAHHASGGREHSG